MFELSKILFSLFIDRFFIRRRNKRSDALEKHVMFRILPFIAYTIIKYSFRSNRNAIWASKIFLFFSLLFPSHDSVIHHWTRSFLALLMNNDWLVKDSIVIFFLLHARIVRALAIFSGFLFPSSACARRGMRGKKISHAAWTLDYRERCRRHNVQFSGIERKKMRTTFSHFFSLPLATNCRCVLEDDDDDDDEAWVGENVNIKNKHSLLFRIPSSSSSSSFYLERTRTEGKKWEKNVQVVFFPFFYRLLLSE